MDFATARTNMVESQLRTNRVTSEAVAERFRQIPREMFVSEANRNLAYVDEDLPVQQLGSANLRYLMEPMVLGRLIQEAELSLSDTVLDVGCTSGYASVVMAGLVSSVVALDQEARLLKRAEEIIEELEIYNITIEKGKLTGGWKAQAPYDVILVNGAVPEAPTALTDQLADGGRLLAVIDTNSDEPDNTPGRATLFLRTGDHISDTYLFDAHVKPLPGFSQPKTFEF